MEMFSFWIWSLQPQALLFFLEMKSTNFWWHRDNVHRSLHIGRCKITFSTLMSRHHKIKRTESYFMHIVTTCSFACMNPIKRLNRSGNRCACGFLHSKYLMQIWGFFRCHPISLQSVFHVLSMCVNWKNYALWSLIVSIINIQFYFAVWNEALDNSQVSHVSIICLKTRVLKDWMLEFRKFQTFFISSIEPKVWIYDEVFLIK